MRIIKFNGHLIELFDSIQELPITRFQTYNLNLLIDGGIGSDLNDFDQHISKIARLISKDQEAAIRQLQNMQQNVHFIMSKTSPEMNSFAVMIKSIDGREIKESDLTDKGIEKIINEIGKKGFTVRKLKEVLGLVKKKLDMEFDTFFPKMTDSATVTEFYSKLRQRTSLVLKAINEAGEDIEKKIALIDDFFVSRIKPKQYHGRNGLEVKMIKGFEETCVLLSQYNVSDNPRKMTALAFYQALHVVQEQLKKRKK